MWKFWFMCLMWRVVNWKRICIIISCVWRLFFRIFLMLKFFVWCIKWIWFRRISVIWFLKSERKIWGVCFVCWSVFVFECLFGMRCFIKFGLVLFISWFLMFSSWRWILGILFKLLRLMKFCCLKELYFWLFFIISVKSSVMFIGLRRLVILLNSLSWVVVNWLFFFRVWKLGILILLFLLIFLF